MRPSPHWFALALFLLTCWTVAHAQTPASPIKVNSLATAPAPFKPNQLVTATSAVAVRPPDGFFGSSHSLSLSFTWTVSDSSGQLATVTTNVAVLPPYQYASNAGPTSAHPIILTTGTLAWNAAQTANGCLPDGKFGTLITVGGVVDGGSSQAVVLPSATRSATITCKGDLPLVSELSPAANTLLATSPAP